jgi:hypothetical protein
MLDSIIELILYLLIPGFRRKKKRDEEWTGVVEEKRVMSDYSVAKYKCIVIFRRDDGMQTKLEVDEQDFILYEVGKRYQKQKGQDFPVPITE